MTAPRWANGPVSLLLRSPLHRLLSRRLMLITVRGRVTGQPHTLPVGYLETDDGLYILVGEFGSKRWWHNLERGGGTVQLTLRGTVVDAYATVLHTAFEPALAGYLSRFHGPARHLDVPIVRGLPDATAVYAATHRVLMVRCSLA